MCEVTKMTAAQRCVFELRLVYEGEKTPSYTYGDFQTAEVVQMATNGDKTLFGPHLEGK